MASGDNPSNSKGQPGLVSAALSGSCPRCGEPTLFEAPARVALECASCKLDFTRYERGARLAGLVTILLAALLIGLAMLADFAFDPPLWLQLAFWAPVTVGTVIFVLRFYKTALLYSRYAKEAGQ